MSATSRTFSGGTKLKVYDPGATAWRDILGIVNIPGLAPATEDVEATELDPYAGGSTTPAVYQFIKRTIAGWTDLGELELEANMTAQEYSALQGWQLANTATYWRIDFRSGYTVGMFGYVKKVGIASQQTELVKAPVTIKLTDLIFFGLTSTLTSPWA